MIDGEASQHPSATPPHTSGAPTGAPAADQTVTFDEAARAAQAEGGAAPTARPTVEPAPAASIAAAAGGSGVAPVAATAAEEGATGGEGDASEEEDAVPAGPKMVRRVVVSYQLGWLPGDWLQTWRRLDRVFARADIKVKATLAPLEDLPADTDILVVPPELREAAREAAPPGTPILVTPASSAAGAFADLLSRLQAGTDFTAEQFGVGEHDGPRIVSYRGHTIID